MNAADQPPDAYGGFCLGGMRLALPMSSLREVVPSGQLCELPCPAACVIGGLDLRGVIVPVVDLRVLLGRDRHPAAYASVIIMVHEGRILGLLADGVTGVFTAPAGHLNRIHTDDDLKSLFSGSIRRPDDATLVSVLSPEALSRLPQVPMVQDPEPARQHDVDETDTRGGAELVAPVPVMLIRCGRIPLAIDAMAVHATLSDPRVEPSLLATGHCRGVIPYGGSFVPALDLLSWSGLGELAENAWRQAFVVRLDAGMVAFLVEAVVDIVPIQPQQVIALPRFALPRPELFAGALSRQALPGHDIEHDRRHAAQYLVLASDALCTDPQVVALSRVNTSDADRLSSAAAAGNRAAGAQRAAPARNVITFSLGHETATPIEQVREILPYRAEQTEFDTHTAVRGVAVLRDRSVAILCLGSLTTGASPELTDSASVLVVESDGELIGFAVPALTAIEPTHWQPDGPDASTAGDPSASPTASSADSQTTSSTVSRRLALVGAGGRERMLPMLDLLALARSLQEQAALA